MPKDDQHLLSSFLSHSPSFRPSRNSYKHFYACTSADRNSVILYLTLFGAKLLSLFFSLNFFKILMNNVFLNPVSG